MYLSFQVVVVAAAVAVVAAVAADLNNGYDYNHHLFVHFYIQSNHQP